MASIIITIAEATWTVPVAEKLMLQDFSNHQSFRSSPQFQNNKFSDGWNENQYRTGDYTVKMIFSQLLFQCPLNH